MKPHVLVFRWLANTTLAEGRVFHFREQAQILRVPFVGLRPVQTHSRYGMAFTCRASLLGFSNVSVQISAGGVVVREGDGQIPPEAVRGVAHAHPSAVRAYVDGSNLARGCCPSAAKRGRLCPPRWRCPPRKRPSAGVDGVVGAPREGRSLFA